MNSLPTDINGVDTNNEVSVELADKAGDATLVLSVAGKAVLRAFEATTFFTRLRGLHAHLPLDDEQALVISGCHAIHTLTMRQSIDVVFVDRHGCVLDVKTVPKLRFASASKAVAVVEMNAGICARLGIIAGVVLHRDKGKWR